MKEKQKHEQNCTKLEMMVMRRDEEHNGRSIRLGN
jgi:hypothetical protein